MEEKALIFDEQWISKNAFHKNKPPISIDKVDIKSIVLSKKDLFSKKDSFKYFIGYIPLCIKLLKWIDMTNILIATTSIQFFSSW